MGRISEVWIMCRYILALAFTLIATHAQADHAQQVKALVEPLVKSKSIVGCVVGVIDNGKTEVYGFGETHRGESDKPNGDTVYEIGSITKAFTGTLLGDMVNRGV